MADDMCQCPKCGRLHRDLGFGALPASIAAAQVGTDMREAAIKFLADSEHVEPAEWSTTAEAIADLTEFGAAIRLAALEEAGKWLDDEAARNAEADSITEWDRKMDARDKITVLGSRRTKTLKS